MNWKEPFRKLGEEFNQKELKKKERHRQARESIKKIRDERKQIVRQVAPQIREVCKGFAKALGWGVWEHIAWSVKESDSIDRSIVWLLEHKKKVGGGALQVLTFPLDNSLPLEGIWIGYAGHVRQEKVHGTEVPDLGTLASSGYYYETSLATIAEKYCFFGYFLSLSDFTSERLATILEEFGRHLLTLDIVSDYTERHVMKSRGRKI